MTQIARNAELGEVAEFVRGITFKPDDVVPFVEGETIACMRTKNIQLDLDTSDVWSLPAGLVKRDEQLLQLGDILVSTANSWNLVGKCCWVPALPWPTTLGGFISALRPKNGEIDPRYLYWWFSSNDVQAEVRACARQTTNIANLSFEQCLAINIPLPRLEDQRRIAAILDQADDLRRKRREALHQADRLAHAIYREEFGDPVANTHSFPNTTLGALGVEIKYGPRFYNESYSENGIRIVRITDLSEAGDLNFDAMPKLAVPERELDEHRSRSGELLFARTGATVGKLALIAPDDPVCIPGAYFIRMRFPASVNPTFAWYTLRSKQIQDIIFEGSRQSAQQNFSGPGLRRLPFIVPPLSLQQEFAAIVTAATALKTHHRAHLAKLDSLFASLQHRAFRGEL